MNLKKQKDHNWYIQTFLPETIEAVGREISLTDLVLQQNKYLRQLPQATNQDQWYDAQNFRYGTLVSLTDALRSLPVASFRENSFMATDIHGVIDAATGSALNLLEEDENFAQLSENLQALVYQPLHLIFTYYTSKKMQRGLDKLVLELDKSVKKSEGDIYSRTYQELRGAWTRQKILEKAETRKRTAKIPIIEKRPVSEPVWTKEVSIGHWEMETDEWGTGESDKEVWIPSRMPRISHYERVYKTFITGYNEASVEWKDVTSLEKQIKSESKKLAEDKTMVALSTVRAEAEKKVKRYIQENVASAVMPYLGLLALKNGNKEVNEEVNVKNNSPNNSSSTEQPTESGTSAAYEVVPFVQDIFDLVFPKPTSQLEKVLDLLKEIGSKDPKEWGDPTKPVGYVLEKLVSTVPGYLSFVEDSLKNVPRTVREAIDRGWDEGKGALGSTFEPLPSALKELMYSVLKNHYKRKVLSFVEQESSKTREEDDDYYYHESLSSQLNERDIFSVRDLTLDEAYGIVRETQKIAKQHAEEKISQNISARSRDYPPTAIAEVLEEVKNLITKK